MVLPALATCDEVIEDTGPKSNSSGREVAATVRGRPVYSSQVDREVRKIIGRRSVEPGRRSKIRAEVLEQLVNRQRVLLYLEKKGIAPSDADIQLEISRFRKQLEDRSTALEQYLHQAEMRRSDFEEEVRWRLGWSRLLDKYLTQDNLAHYFDRHRADFDGRRLQVAHILWKVDQQDSDTEAQSSDGSLNARLKEAKAVLQKLQDDVLTFEEAAVAYSQAPSARQGGDIGWIKRHDPMPEAFSHAAFQLEEGEIGGPVVTPFGVHLIRCLQIEPGKRTWQDARDQISEAMSKELFRWAARQTAAND